mmetsp:Transcript_19868/g.44289  ORF Transcript_19868/g.44289 Transcript_19868/m.44289 type:complete len:302 (-) Transcript_19868:19-924(-)
MKAPDDISDYQPSDDDTDAAHYDGDDDDDNNNSLSLSATAAAGLLSPPPPVRADLDLPDGGDAAAGSTDTGTAVRSLAQLLVGRNVFLVRHGNTADTAADGGTAADDSKRKLTQRGEHQCANFLALYGDHMERIVYCLSSPTQRTVATSSFLGYPDPTRVDCLYYRTYCTDEMQKLDDMLGYAPLGDYLDYNDGYGATMYGPVRTMLGRELATALAMEFDKAETVGEFEGDVLIVTHATTISLLAMTILEACSGGGGGGGGGAVDAVELEKVLTFNVGECEGFKISASSDDRKVELLLNSN